MKRYPDTKAKLLKVEDDLFQCATALWLVAKHFDKVAEVLAKESNSEGAALDEAGAASNKASDISEFLKNKREEVATLARSMETFRRGHSL